jgi:hypothetical protein
MIPQELQGAPVMLQLNFLALVVEVIERLHEMNKEDHGFLTEHEKEILDFMRSGKAESLEIKLNDGLPVSYRWKEKGLVPEEDIYNVIKDFKTRQYGSIVLKTNNNKSIYYEAESKKKL